MEVFYLQLFFTTWLFFKTNHIQRSQQMFYIQTPKSYNLKVYVQIHIWLQDCTSSNIYKPTLRVGVKVEDIFSGFRSDSKSIFESKGISYISDVFKKSFDLSFRKKK
jgi:hypothetical protein